jgi:anaerobic magnesium-protoporphyrin IX monomethyl ester cyclase
MTPTLSERAPVLLAHSYFMHYDPKQLRKMKPYAPLSTLLTAAVLRNAGVRLGFFDAMLSTGTGEFADAVRATRPRVVGILEDNFNFLTKMCTVRMREAAFTMIATAKGMGCRVVVNGSDATDHTAAYLAAGADAVILGETDTTFLELVRAWGRAPDPDLSGIAGLALPPAAPGGQPRYTPVRHSIVDLDALPLPAWDLVDGAAYRTAWTEAHGRFSWNACTSRGCPFGCNWCAKPVFGRRYTQRTPGNVAGELRQLRDRLAPDHIWFADDIFGLTTRWIEDFAREVNAHHSAIPFTMQSRVDLMTPAAVDALADAQCEEVWMGVESGSQHIIDAMDKGTELDEVRNATRRLKDRGIRAGWFIQLGYSGESWDDILATRDLVRSERPDDVGVSVAYPLPGTVFYDRVHAELRGKENWKDSDDLAMMFQGTYTTSFYREIRDLLHQEVEELRHAQPMTEWPVDAHWRALEAREGANRSVRSAPARRAALG